MIENSDRGITLAKPLAWTILVGLVSAGIWVGTTSGSIRTELAALVDNVAEIQTGQSIREQRDREDRASIEARLRAVETSRAQDASEIGALRRDLGEFRNELKEATSLLRQAIDRETP